MTYTGYQFDILIKSFCLTSDGYYSIRKLQELKELAPVIFGENSDEFIRYIDEFKLPIKAHITDFSTFLLLKRRDFNINMHPEFIYKLPKKEDSYDKLRETSTK